MGFALRQIDLSKYSEKTGKPVSELINNKVKPPAVPNWPFKPDSIVGLSVCNTSGLLPNPSSPCETRFEYFQENNVPSDMENLRKSILINKTNGQPIQPGEINLNQLPDWIEPQDHNVIIDSLNTVFCLDCPPLPPEQKPIAAIINPLNFLTASPTP